MKFLPRRRAAVALASVPVLLVSVVAGTASAKPKGDDGSIDHVVVIYEENHSFDNLFGGWERVNGLADATPRTQVDVNGNALPCLPQNDVNLASPPLSPTCSGSTSNGITINSHFANAPFAIDDYIKPTDTTCPDPKVFAPVGVLKGSGLPGGCTRDIVHRYYNEQYQIDGGKQDRYATGSDAAGLTMGHYSTRSLPIYAYLHSAGAPHYAIADNFFQGAFGGSFLNHQWLIAAATPTFPNAVRDYGPNDLHSIVGPDGFPSGTPLHPASPGTKDAALTQAADPDGSCTIKLGVAAPPANTVCGDYAVNTIQPTYQPYAPGTPVAKQLPPQTAPTIGDRLSAKGVDWAWYSGGWSNADGDVGAPGWTNGSTPGTCTDPQTANGAVYPNCPNALFQYHHQPFNYFANYAPGTAARAAHLRDEAEFIAAAKSGNLKPVSFVKPIGAENEHPGYASESNGSSHLVDLIKAIQSGPEAKHTLIVVTYDEFGGQWDHVAPPMGRRGISDQWGPGTRIPELTISPLLKHPFSVDETEHDTTSILTTIEHLYRLAPLTSRDASVKDLFRAPVFPGNRP
ncbi:MAG TPA: acid phosphatase [Jatrophihabitans sp.]|jgi:phospholipase C|uniref:acid phosphatase n=1 Tax=Jatrophihabitans sp. TaxID=1932789 RepID=UPI002E0031B3|nr:acid phosphatase [Jatrophihabitans sp.]